MLERLKESCWCRFITGWHHEAVSVIDYAALNQMFSYRNSFISELRAECLLCLLLWFDSQLIRGQIWFGFLTWFSLNRLPWISLLGWQVNVQSPEAELYSLIKQKVMKKTDPLEQQTGSGVRWSYAPKLLLQRLMSIPADLSTSRQQGAPDFTWSWMLKVTRGEGADTSTRTSGKSSTSPTLELQTETLQRRFLWHQQSWANQQETTNGCRAS